MGNSLDRTEFIRVKVFKITAQLIKERMMFTVDTLIKAAESINNSLITDGEFILVYQDCIVDKGIELGYIEVRKDNTEWTKNNNIGLPYPCKIIRSKKL